MKRRPSRKGWRPAAGTALSASGVDRAQCRPAVIQKLIQPLPARLRHSHIFVGRRPHRPVAVKPLRGCSAALRPLRGASAGPMWRSASMIFAERSRPAGPACAAKIMEIESLSRAQGSMFASETSNPRSGLDIDAEHGSGTADPEVFGTGCVNPIAYRGGDFRAYLSAYGDCPGHDGGQYFRQLASEAVGRFGEAIGERMR